MLDFSNRRNLIFNINRNINFSLTNKKIYLVFLFFKNNLASDDKQSISLTKKEIILRGTIIAIIISVPSLIAFVLTWMILDNMIAGAILGAVIHFIAMGFSLKISKKILVKK